MLSPIITSLVLPYVRSERRWVMLSARTSKSLSLFLDSVQHHWDHRYKKLLSKLRSGRARFEITRHVRCCMRDQFYWSDRNQLDGFAFTVTVVEQAHTSFARQAVPQLKRILGLVERTLDGVDIDVIFTARSRMRTRTTPFIQGCNQAHFIGAIPVRAASTPTELVRGDLDALGRWLEPWEDEEGGYDTDESWVCECGEVHHTSLDW